MVTLFISHSRYDEAIRDYFSNIIGSTEGVDHVLMEFELEGQYPGQRIVEKMAQPATKALFVLLGPGLTRSQYTVNWVTFEVGLAAALHKDIWVFEQFNDDIHFPVPYVDHYVLYNLGDRDHFQFIRRKASAYTLFFVGMKNNILMEDNPEYITCAHPSCGASYYLHSVTERIKCPVCRQELVAVPPTEKTML